MREQLSGTPCRAFTSDLGVRVIATGLATYPDVSVVCGATERDPDKRTNVLNPRVLVEITSDSTEDYDRGEKLAHHKQIPSLEAVVLVSHRRPEVEVWLRPDASLPWSSVVSGPGERATVVGGCSLDVDAIWQAAQER